MDTTLNLLKKAVVHCPFREASEDLCHYYGCMKKCKDFYKLPCIFIDGVKISEKITKEVMFQRALESFIDNCSNRSYSEDHNIYECEIDFSPCNEECYYFQSFMKSLQD